MEQQLLVQPSPITLYLLGRPVKPLDKADKFLREAFHLKGAFKTIYKEGAIHFGLAFKDDWGRGFKMHWTENSWEDKPKFYNSLTRYRNNLDCLLSYEGKACEYQIKLSNIMQADVDIKVLLELVTEIYENQKEYDLFKNNCQRVALTVLNTLGINQSFLEKELKKVDKKTLKKFEPLVKTILGKTLASKISNNLNKKEYVPSYSYVNNNNNNNNNLKSYFFEDANLFNQDNDSVQFNNKQQWLLKKIKEKEEEAEEYNKNGIKYFQLAKEYKEKGDACYKEYEKCCSEVSDLCNQVSELKDESSNDCENGNDQLGFDKQVFNDFSKAEQISQDHKLALAMQIHAAENPMGSQAFSANQQPAEWRGNDALFEDDSFYFSGKGSNQSPH